MTWRGQCSFCPRRVQLPEPPPPGKKVRCPGCRVISKVEKVGDDPAAALRDLLDEIKGAVGGGGGR